MYSVIVPVYRNVDTLPQLLEELSGVAATVSDRFETALEVVFVVDGSPDDEFSSLRQLLPGAPFRSKLLLHSRNFGSFAAIRTGLKAASGDYCGVISADLQEPPELLIDFLTDLTRKGSDIVVGVREQRDDPALSRMSAGLFWRLYRLFVMPKIPAGGVDLFACNKRVREELLNMMEANTSLVGLVFWLGFRRSEVPYVRSARRSGKGAWTLRKKLRYVSDSVFAFTDLPIRILNVLGVVGVVFSLVFGLVVLLVRLIGGVNVPGYTPIVLTIVFFGALNMIGLGLVGAYAWRSYENTKGRPLSIVSGYESFEGVQTRG